MTISPEQSRAARGLLNWNQGMLATRSNVARNTIARFEVGMNVPGPNNMIAIQKAFEDAGVLFVEHDDIGGPGVRLKKRDRGTP
jgi:hypothetical protein